MRWRWADYWTARQLTELATVMSTAAVQGEAEAHFAHLSCAQPTLIQTLVSDMAEMKRNMALVVSQTAQQPAAAVSAPQQPPVAPAAPAAATAKANASYAAKAARAPRPKLLVLLPSPGQRKSTSGALCPLPLALPVTQGVQMFNLDVPRGGLATLQSSMVARDLVASHCLPSQHQHHPSPLAPSRAMPHPLATQPTSTGPKSALLRPWRALEVHLDLQALPGPFLGLKSSSQLSAPALFNPRTPPPNGEAPQPPG